MGREIKSRQGTGWQFKKKIFCHHSEMSNMYGLIKCNKFLFSFQLADLLVEWMSSTFITQATLGGFLGHCFFFFVGGMKFFSADSTKTNYFASRRFNWAPAILQLEVTIRPRFLTPVFLKFRP
jgi:hypothetical protein